VREARQGPLLVESLARCPSTRASPATLTGGAMHASYSSAGPNPSSPHRIAISSQREVMALCRSPLMAEARDTSHV
jgi:hypothetical protein